MPLNGGSGYRLTMRFWLRGPLSGFFKNSDNREGASKQFQLASVGGDRSLNLCLELCDKAADRFPFGMRRYRNFQRAKAVNIEIHPPHISH